jgi:hypothetical protein
MTDTRFELRTFGSNCMLNHHLALIQLKKKKKKKSKNFFLFLEGKYKSFINYKKGTEQTTI